MLAAAIQTPGFLSSEAIADVVMRSYTDLIDVCAAMPGADAAGQIIADFATAHALALVRLAQLEQVSLPKAAARLVLLVKEG